MKITRFRVYSKELKKMIYVGAKHNDTYIMFTENGVWFVYDTFQGEHELIASSEHGDILMQFTGYQMDDKDVCFDDLVSNNFGTEKEVIRQIVEYKGCKMMKRIIGNSSLPKYILLDIWHKLNLAVGNSISQLIVVFDEEQSECNSLDKFGDIG